MQFEFYLVIERGKLVTNYFLGKLVQDNFEEGLKAYYYTQSKRITWSVKKNFLWFSEKDVEDPRQKNQLSNITVVGLIKALMCQV